MVIMSELQPEAKDNINALTTIRYHLVQGLTSYEQARAEAQPIIDRMNARGAEIARESGMKFKPLNFSYLMR